MKDAGEGDRVLIEHIRNNWGPPAGRLGQFEAAGRRVRMRRRRNRRLRTGIFSAVLLLLALSVGLTNRPPPETDEADWLAYTAGRRTPRMDLPPEYEALLGTIYRNEEYR